MIQRKGSSLPGSQDKKMVEANVKAVKSETLLDHILLSTLSVIRNFSKKPSSKAKSPSDKLSIWMLSNTTIAMR